MVMTPRQVSKKVFVRKTTWKQNAVFNPQGLIKMLSNKKKELYRFSLSAAFSKNAHQRPKKATSS